MALSNEARPEPKPDDTTSADDAIPAACQVYEASVATAVGCEKLPDMTRIKIKEDYDKVAATFLSPPEGRDALATACQAAADQVSAMAALCGSKVPPECQDYRAAIYELAACEKLPQETRDALKESFEETAKAWDLLGAEERASMATACKEAADAVRQSAVACTE